MEQAKQAVAQNFATLSQVGATYRFLLEGEGGGTWIVALNDDADVTEGDGAADCTIKMAASDYVDMMEGRAFPQELFFEGRLEIDGDIALALRLEALNEVMA